MQLKNKIYLEDGHDLIEKRTCDDGPLGLGTYRFYDEVDGDNNVVARYEYWDCTSMKPPFGTVTGYRKFDLENHLLEEETF